MADIWDKATAIGTVGAVVIAAFTFWVPRLRWFRPRLAVTIYNDIGIPQRVVLNDTVTASRIQGDARYFHVRVSNANRHAKATKVRVVVKKMEVIPDDGKRKVFFDYPSGIRLKWQHEHETGSERTMGADDFADLFFICKDPHAPERGTILFEWTFSPVGVPTEIEYPCTLLFTVQAHSEEISSAETVFSVKWDGRYSTEGISVTQ